MPKVKQVKARKDYPEHGVKKGDLHYTWSLMLGARHSRTFRQIAPPRPSQLTTSEYLGGMGDIEHDFGAFEMTHDEAAEEFLQGVIEQLESLAESEEEKFENVPENLQYSENAQRMEERAEAARSWASEIESYLDEARDRAEEISTLDWWELDEFSSIDPESDDEDDFPTQDEIDVALNSEIDAVWTACIEDCANACPGYE